MVMKTPRASVAREMSRNNMVFSNLALEVMKHYFHCILFIEAVTSPTQVQRERT